MRVSHLLLVFGGGGCGATLRAVLLELFPAQEGLPVMMLLINCLGALGLGWLAGFLASPTVNHWVPGISQTCWLLLGTGALGGLTSYSTLAMALAQLSLTGQWSLAVLYAVLSLVGGYAAAWAGLTWGRGKQ